MATEIGKSVNANRCFAKSEAKAIIMANANAHAHGGTLCSCVSMAE